MCGIVGYKGSGKTSKILLNCIKNLEYRGYDSIGLAIKNKKNIVLKKDIGKISEVDNKLNFLTMNGNMGIAHTRWATNGLVTKKNTHPHFSNDKNIYLIHNGIIENHQDLKKELEKQGIILQTQTDSEVIPQFISYYVSKGETLKDSVRKTLLKLKGSFAIIAINKKDDSMIIARKDSPLVVGIKTVKNNKNDKINKEFFIASDVPAFLDYTDEVVYIDDNEYGIINDDLSIFNIQTNDKITKNTTKITWDKEQAKKGNYEHFMMKEIHEQEHTVKKAVEQDPKLLQEVINTIQNAYGIFFVGCGTSYHAAISSSYIFSHIAKKHVNVILASEFRNYNEFLTEKTVMIAISQSGETADLLDAVKTAKDKNVKIISIVNVMGSTLTRLSDINIMMNAGPEICVLSTKSYTSQLAILLLLAYGIVDKIEEAKTLVMKSSKEIKKIIDTNSKKIKKIAEKIQARNDLFLIGRDLAFPSALEGALKIKEVSYIHAEGFAGGELKHGTMALIEKNTPCITLTTNATRQMILSNASEIKAREGFIIGIDSTDNEIYDELIKVQELGNANPIVMIIPIQILAYYLAIKRGCDPDKPRNLAKSVTVR